MELPLQAQKKDESQFDITKVLQISSDLSRRVRTLEERLRASRERLDIVDDSVHDTLQKVNDDVLDLKNELLEVNTVLEEFRKTLQQIIKQLSIFARKGDVLALEKYVDLMDPSRYLTKSEIVSLIEERSRSKRKKVNKK